MSDSAPYKPPQFCSECGTAFPWTQRALDAAKSLTDEETGLTPEEKTVVKNSIDELISDTPLMPVAANRFNTLLKKFAPQASELVKSIVLSVATGEAKKHLGLR
jgi:hypothetical protein